VWVCLLVGVFACVCLWGGARRCGVGERVERKAAVQALDFAGNRH